MGVKGRKLTEKEFNGIAYMFAGGASQREISEILHTSRETVRKVIDAGSYEIYTGTKTAHGYKKVSRTFTIAESVAELKRLIAEDRIRELGETVLSRNGMDWKVIHKDEDGIVIQMCRAYDYRPFSRPDKHHPWGWNNYMASQIRKELNTEVIEALFGDEQELIEDWQGIGRLFLMSEEEVGFRQTEDTFQYYRGEDEDELDRKRQLLDGDGDPAYWWLRSPYPSIAYIVRYVYSDGSLSSVYAGSGTSAAAACYIRKS